MTCAFCVLCSRIASYVPLHVKANDTIYWYYYSYIYIAAISYMHTHTQIYAYIHTAT